MKEKLFFLLLGFMLGGIAGYTLGMWPSQENVITESVDRIPKRRKNLPPMHPPVEENQNLPFQSILENLKFASK